MKNDSHEHGSKGTATAERPTSEKRAGSPSGANPEEMMKKAQAAAAPGQEHKWLQHFVGSWKCEVKCWMDPDGPANESKGTAKGSSIMGGRFLQEDFQGEMMGQPFQGRTVMGYSKQKAAFQSVWIDEMNTAMFVSEGKGDEKTITLEGKSSCPATGRTDIPMRVVLRVLSPTKHTLEMFDGSKGGAKTMEISYSRQD
ncbi:MAG: DUF1579 domain-containing protein [Verrucomicrobiota bacterium]